MIDLVHLWMPPSLDLRKTHAGLLGVYWCNEPARRLNIDDPPIQSSTCSTFSLVPVRVQQDATPCNQKILKYFSTPTSTILLSPPNCMAYKQPDLSTASLDWSMTSFFPWSLGQRGWVIMEGIVRELPPRPPFCFTTYVSSDMVVQRGLRQQEFPVWDLCSCNWSVKVVYLVHKAVKFHTVNTFTIMCSSKALLALEEKTNDFAWQLPFVETKRKPRA